MVRSTIALNSCVYLPYSLLVERVIAESLVCFGYRSWAWLTICSWGLESLCDEFNCIKLMGVPSLHFQRSPVIFQCLNTAWLTNFVIGIGIREYDRIVICFSRYKYLNVTDSV